MKFRENPFSGSRVVPCGRKVGQTDKHDEANSRFWQFCESTRNRENQAKTHNLRYTGLKEIKIQEQALHNMSFFVFEIHIY
jgi:hypothetical protein